MSIQSLAIPGRRCNSRRGLEGRCREFRMLCTGASNHFRSAPVNTMSSLLQPNTARKSRRSRRRCHAGRRNTAGTANQSGFPGTASTLDHTTECLALMRRSHQRPRYTCHAHRTQHRCSCSRCRTTPMRTCCTSDQSSRCRPCRDTSRWCPPYTSHGRSSRRRDSCSCPRTSQLHRWSRSRLSSPCLVCTCSCL